MKRFALLILLVAFVGLPAFAQKGYTPKGGPAYGHLTIISEDGEPFFLFVNGVQYNKRAAEAVRIEQVRDANYSIRIEFENRRLPNVTSSGLRVADEEGYMQDITYSVSTKRRGTRALMLYSVMPMYPIYFNVDEMAVYNMGRAGARVSVNNDYRNMWGTPRNDYRGGRGPLNHGGNVNRQPDRNTHVVPKCPPMPAKEFNEAINSIKDEAFESNKFQTAKILSATFCLTTDQIVTIVGLFSFESTKLDFAKYEYPNCIDPQNYFKVSQAFTFSSSKDELNKFILSMMPSK